MTDVTKVSCNSRATSHWAASCPKSYAFRHQAVQFVCVFIFHLTSLVLCTTRQKKKNAFAAARGERWQCGLLQIVNIYCSFNNRRDTHQKIGMWGHRDMIMKQLIRVICENITLCNWLQTQQYNALDYAVAS